MRKSRVLVVDDLPFMRNIIRDALGQTGYFVVEEAENGLVGLQKYRALKPDVVLLDIVMPVLDGISALERLMRMDPKARVVMCSALGQEEMIVRAIQLGAIDFVVKPFQPDRLVGAIQRALDM